MVLTKDVIYVGDCLSVLAEVEDQQVDLVVTSPPYADQRARSYGGVHPDHYVDWFLPRAEQLLRVLKPTGSFVLNIKEKVVDGQRHTYVLDLIKALQAQGWLWTEEYIWHKRSCSPGKWPNRFRDAWERCLHFTMGRRFKMNQDAVMVPTGNWAEARLRNLSDTDKRRDDSRVGSGFGKKVANWVGRTHAYPSNVLTFAAETRNRRHSAAFPKALPEFFVRLFSDPDDLVCDPFCGSGTTCVVARDLGRHYLGIDLMADYCEAARARLEEKR